MRLTNRWPVSRPPRCSLRAVADRARLIPKASAACPGAEVVFARGREEPPGLGPVGDALVNSLRVQGAACRSGPMGSTTPPTSAPPRAPTDMSAHVQSMAEELPEHPRGARRLFAGRRGGRPGDRADPTGIRVHQPAAAGHGSARRGGRVVRQWHPAHLVGSRFQPRLRRQDDRRVRGRATRSVAVARRMVVASAARPTSTPDWWIRPPVSSPAGFSRANADPG